MSRVTGHKEPLCQVTERTEKDKGLEGCDMTNMRGFEGLRGYWRYSQGWLTLLICITHQSRSQQRRADAPHTWSLDTPGLESDLRIHTDQQESKRKCLNYSWPINTGLMVAQRLCSSLPLKPGRWHKDLICFMKIYLYDRRCPKVQNRPPAADKTVISPPQRAGSKIST